MLDEKLDDQVWVTVVATGYDERRRRAADGRGLSEPTGELRVKRTSRPAAPMAAGSRRRGASLTVAELDVPEFMP
jgi:cell division protein FtsZ